MNKFSKLMFTGLLLGGLILPVSGCVTPTEPFVPPESSDKVIINDAYDWNEDETGSTRPELGGGYVPAPPAKEAVLTLAEGSVIKFKDGSPSITLNVGELLTDAHFDESTLNGRRVGGVAVVGEDGKITEVSALKDFVPTEAVTVLPFYSLEKGVDALFGSGLIGDWIHDADFNDISETVEITGSPEVAEGWLSNKIDVNGTLAEGSSFRVLTPYTVNEGYDYTYSYRFVNHGQTAVSFSVYQMREGYRWDNAVTSVPVETITLQAGASSEIVSVKLENNAENENVMTVIKVNDGVENLSLGVSMAIEDNTVQGPAKITLKLPDGVVDNGTYVTDVTTFDKLVLPTAEDITNNSDMGEILGWFDTATGKVVNENTTIIRSMTIAPYWQKVNGYDGRIDIGSGAGTGYNTAEVPGDIVKHITANTGSVSYSGNVYKQTAAGVVVNGGDGYSVLGSVISDNLPVQAGSAIRFDSARTAPAGIYEFNYTVENRGSSKLHLSVYQINTGKDYQSDGGYYRYEAQRYRTEIVLNPGESTVALGQYDFTGQTNGNWLTYIVFEEDVDSFCFGIAASYKQVEEYDGDKYPVGNLLDKTVTISYDAQANGGITVKDSYLTKRVGRFIVAPSASECVIPEDVIFMGWQLVIRGKTYDLPENRKNWTDLQVPSSGATLKAKFSKVTTTPVKITAADIEDFELSQSYLDKDIFVGGYFVVPEESEYTNNTGLPIVGWKDAATGTLLTKDTIITLESVVLEPIFAETVSVTLQLPEGLTVSGFKSSQAKGGKLTLPSESNITANATGMGTPYGWYNTVTKETVTADTVLTGDIKIAPYWSTADGYTYVQVGSGKGEGYNNDELPGDFGKHITDKTGSVSYKGHTGGKEYTNGNAEMIFDGKYYVLGSVISDNLPVQAGSAIRLDSKRTAPAGIYEFNYTVENRGSSKLRLSVYQINLSSDYKSGGGYYRYETERYRTEIVVDSGKSTVALGQYDFTGQTNGNWLTYIVFEEDVNSFDFGIAIGYKSITALGDDYKNQTPLVNNVKLTYNPDDNGGITVKDSYLTQRAGRFAVAPKAEDIELNGKRVSKWQIVIGGKAYDLPASTTSYTDVQIPSSGATLKAVLAEQVSVTYSADNGVSVEGAKTSYYTGDKLELPAVAAATADGRKHVGWYDTATRSIVTSDTEVTGAMKIAPYFAPENTALTPACGEQGADRGLDKFTNIVEDKFWKETDKVIGDEAGTIFNYSDSIAAGDAFRFKTFYYEGGSKNAAAATYKFHFTFVNYGTEELKFTVYQVNSGVDTNGAPKQEITLAAGASIDVTLELTITANKNALTYFVMGGAASSMSLGVAMSIEGLAA